MKIMLAAGIAYIGISYRIAWKATPVSRPFGRNTLFIFATWPVAEFAQWRYLRTGKWPKWYPSL